MTIETDSAAHKPAADRKFYDNFMLKLRGSFEPKSFQHEVIGGAVYELSILVMSKKTCADPAAVLAFEFYDLAGERVAASRGFSSSRSFEAYRRISCSTKAELVEDLMEIEVPQDAVSMKTILHSWHDSFIKLKQPPQLRIVKEPRLKQPVKASVSAATEKFDVKPGQEATVKYLFKAGGEPKMKYAIVRFVFTDAAGEKVNVCPPSLARSKIGVYRYIDYQPNVGFYDVSGAISFQVPAGVAYCEASLMPWKGKIESGSIETSVSERLKRKPSIQNAVQAKNFQFSASSVFGLSVDIQTPTPLKQKGAVLVAKFYDHAGKAIRYTPPGFSISNSVGTYHYVPVTEGHVESNFNYTCFIVPPKNAETCEITVRPWGRTSSLSKVSIESTDTAFGEYIGTEKLSMLSDESLKKLLLVATNLGDVYASLGISQEMLARKQTPQNAFRIRFLKGRLRELDTSWLPKIPKGIKANSKAPKPGSVMHLFKTIYPMESSGGSVRNWSIAKLQAGSNRDIVAAVLQMSSDDIAASSDFEIKKDGFREIVSSGFKTIYYSYFGLEMRAAPSDTLLEFSTAHLAEIMSRENSHIIHAASGFWGYDSALQGLALAKHFTRPFVYEVRSFHEHTWGPLMPHTLESPLTDLRILQENRCMMEADSVITISKALKAQLIKRGVPSKRIFVVPNSINDSFLEKQEESGAIAIRESLGITGKTVIGYISNLSRREGVEILLEGFKKFQKLRPDSVCLIVGDGNEKNNLMSLASEIGIADSVIFTGFVDHNLIKDYYGAIDLFVIPRVEDYASDFVTPMKPFEAMALKRPIIMSDRPVSFEIVGDTETRGLLFETGNPDSLCEKLISMEDDTAATQKRIATAYRWIKKSRTWASQMATYDAAYAFAEREFDRKHNIVREDTVTKKRKPAKSVKAKTVKAKTVKKASTTTTKAKATAKVTTKSAAGPKVKATTTAPKPKVKKSQSAKTKPVTARKKTTAKKAVVKKTAANDTVAKNTVSKKKPAVQKRPSSKKT